MVRARCNFDDAALNTRLGIDKNTPAIWRRRNHIPQDKLDVLVKMMHQDETPDERTHRLIRALDAVRASLAERIGLGGSLSAPVAQEPDVAKRPSLAEKRERAVRKRRVG